MNSKLFLFTCMYFILLFISSIHLCQAKSIPSNETDRLSLIDIKDRIQGLSSWNQSFHFCQWEGVTCRKNHQRVVALDLQNHDLIGPLSPYIGNLSFLRSINLTTNKFYGEIPQEIGRLRRLQYLSLSHNSFERTIPVNLSQCAKLIVLDLRVNKLVCNVPPELGSLSKLEVFGLYSNNLTASIPPSLGNLSNLQQMSIGENHLEGIIPDTIGSLSNLKLFDSEINNLSGPAPHFIFNISTMIVLTLSLNQFYGSLPPDMGLTMPNLETFFVGGNRFSGPLPVSIVNASKIQLFEIRENHFTGNLPTQFGAFQNPSLVSLGINNLGTGEDDDLSFITSLANISNLELLSLEQNNFGGVIPSSISNLSTQLQFLYLGFNQIYGEIPKAIGNLVNLIGLGLENNHLSGIIPSSIGGMQKLQNLLLWENKLNGSIPPSLVNTTQISLFYLNLNELEGKIPSIFGGYKHLQTLSLSENNLIGTIPKEIFSIFSLTNLALANNSFTGSFHVEVGNLINLQEIDVSGNKLSGEIPSTLASCVGLQQLYLADNLFEGAIPQSLSSLKGLQYIDLSRNNLSGAIPVYFDKFQYLERLNLSFNELEGEVPSTGIFGNASIISVAGNSKLCGGIHELQLQSCQSKSTEKQGSSVTLKLVIAICVPAFSLLVVSILLVLHLKRKSKVRASLIPLRDQYYMVSYRDLFQATDGFSSTNLLGSGGFGRVYKGTLRQDEVVAVKVFNLQQKGASKSFMDECESMRSIRHRNLLPILTACSSVDHEGNEFKALIFEFMPNGSLEKWLYGDNEGEIDQGSKLSLHQRLSIAIDVACALNYLHHEAHVSVIHRDLKPSNVLLDNDMVAHVSDFGLAKLLSGSSETQSTSISVKGTIGYAAPEYGMGGDASTLADVYSYGILLLELFTGRRPTDAMFINGLDLHKFCKISLPDKVIEIVDPVLASKEELLGIDVENTSQVTDSEIRNPLDCIGSVVRIGVACSAETPGERMNMGKVVKELQFIRDKSSAFL